VVDHQDREHVLLTAERSNAAGLHEAGLGRALARLDVTQRLTRFRDALGGRIVFTTGFGLEGQVIVHHICEAGLDIDLVTLDTGRLFPETYATWDATERRYGRRIRAIYPGHATLEALTTAQGINGFYQSKEARTACCDARKVDPLARALAGAQGWINRVACRPVGVSQQGGPRRDGPPARHPQTQPAVRLDPPGGTRLRRRS
jgi:phosphoadenosine phosphosulfate reductase